MGQLSSKCFSAKSDPAEAYPARTKAERADHGLVVQGLPCNQNAFAGFDVDNGAELRQLRSEVAELKRTLASMIAEKQPASEAAQFSNDQYDRIQFIPLLLDSGPCQKGDKSVYVGLRNVREDFAARVKFVKAALLRAEEIADKDPRVLKVFSLPEFFFRGPLGAYSLQDTLGDAYHTDGFISQLQELLAGERWAHWFGIFGTMIAYQIAPGRQYRLHNVYNISLCQHGGFRNDAEKGKRCHFILKHWVSEIDFLDGGGPGDDGKIVADDEDWLENHQQHYLDGLRAFGRLQDDCLIRVGGITFGVEICLDHLESRLVRNEPTRKYQFAAPIEVQVVVSAGMSFKDEAMVINRPGGLAFINDGQGCNEGAVDTRTDGRFYSKKDQYERLSPELVPAFPDLSAKDKELLGNLYCMHDEIVPTEPMLGIYPVLKVKDCDDFKK